MPSMTIVVPAGSTRGSNVRVKTWLLNRHRMVTARRSFSLGTWNRTGSK
jgi:hypothetical protein